MFNILFKKAFNPFYTLLFFFLQSASAQTVEKTASPNFKNKFFVKAGISSDYDLYPYWGHNYSLGYGRNIWKNLNINIFYTHCQTNTLKGTVYYAKFLYPDNPVTIGYVNRYLGITPGDLFGGAGQNGIAVHDAFCIKAAYDFRVGKHVYISPFLGVAYGWSKLSTIFLDSANFVNNRMVGGSVGFSYQQGNNFGPDMGVDIGYTFKSKHHQLFFESELILLTTPGDNYVMLSTYEAVQFSLGYNYKF